MDDSDHYESEYFSDNDLYASSQSDMGKLKYTTIENEERSKYNKIYFRFKFQICKIFSFRFSQTAQISWI